MPDTLEESSAPVITEQPASATVVEGDNYFFQVVATGDNLQYCWQCSTDNGTTWTGSRWDIYPTCGVNATVSMNGYQYRCKVKNDDGEVTSNVATLTVLDGGTAIYLPRITQQPVSQTVLADSLVEFSVVVQGNQVLYQWQCTKTDSWLNILGATSATYALSANALLSGTKYRCHITNPAGSVDSSYAELTVTNASGITTPVITSSPKSAMVNTGDPVSFSVVAEGNGLSFQWQVKSDNTWYDIANAISSVLAIVAYDSMDGYQYRCVVANSAGTVTSSVATLTIAPPVPLTFSGYHSLIISGKNTYFEWAMYPTSRPHVAPAEVKTSFIDLPGADGGLDYTDLLTGEPCYGYRKGSWEFLLIPGTSWANVYRDLVSYFHGRKHTVVLEDDPSWRYSGRLSVNEWRSEAHNSIIVIDYVLEPNAVNTEDEHYDPDEDDYLAAARILRKPENTGKVLALIDGAAVPIVPAAGYEDGDNISY